ncbi:hypothetical protein KX928_07870 [Roseobacter sp. YSTF-M11]|uniref:Histidinol phosphate aminotransferase n=1 Tax=Roseobacter insulae TaxID=2859783 RepID=A0A9X1JXZ8_9RHOB|nr:hypothetical protein [Roseobacter insulae]MBW4707701.1 hypothetical protein [Roseobacter insulae]
MERHKLGRAPNYTNACIVMFGVNLAWVLLFLFAIWGLIAAVFLSLAINHWLNWLDFRRRIAEARFAPRQPND